jgi:hypothetical protein
MVSKLPTPVPVLQLLLHGAEVMPGDDVMTSVRSESTSRSGGFCAPLRLV